MMHDQVRRAAHGLRLFGVHAAFERRAEEAVSGQQHPLEFLALILEDEAIFRRERTAKTLITRGRFRSQADLEDWDATFDRGLSRQRLKELAQLSFYFNRENLLILGRTGEGKTHLAIALGRRLCRENISALFIPVSFLFEEVQAAKAAGQYLGYLRRLTQAKTLILDDFGLRSYTHEEASALIDILEDRARKGSVIVTSQVDPKGWRRLFEDPVIAEAIVDRLQNPSQTIALKGGSYREKLQAASAGAEALAQTKPME